MPRTPTVADLRARAIARTLGGESSLAEAIDQLGFVQADPIRAPARAQDLILRHRVAGYRAGDLERHYPALDLEEGVLYAYGFLARPIWQLRHPPNTTRLTQRERALLAAVIERGEAHPDDLAVGPGSGRARNAWGGYSRVATLGLERLHRRGLVRVVRRAQGIRVYAPSPAPAPAVSATEALRRLARVVVGLLAPISERSLRPHLARFRRTLPGVDSPVAAIAALVADGILVRQVVDGVPYLWPTADAEIPPAPRRVRLLAPFDPLVWDRARFEQLWGWAYRFEAYTPVAKRVRGYYALPLLWQDRVVGWGNLRVVEQRLDVELGYVERRPRERDFGAALDAEIERMTAFLRAPP